MTSAARLFIPSVADTASARMIDVTDPRDIDYWTDALAVSATDGMNNRAAEVMAPRSRKWFSNRSLPRRGATPR